MGSQEILNAIKEADTSALPDIHSLSDERLQVLWVLSAAKIALNGTGLAAADIAVVLRDACGIALSRQKVVGLLESEKSAVAKVGRSRPALFKIMKRGEDELQSLNVRMLYINPDKALSTIRSVEEILSGLKGILRVCDTFVDNRTIDYIRCCEAADEIRLLTENVQEAAKLKRDLIAYGKEHATSIEVRVAPSGLLHDRYIVHEDGLLVIGSSLKDIARKQSMIISLSKNFASELRKAYDSVWSRSKVFP